MAWNEQEVVRHAETVMARYANSDWLRFTTARSLDQFKNNVKIIWFWLFAGLFIWFLLTAMEYEGMWALYGLVAIYVYPFTFIAFRALKYLYRRVWLISRNATYLRKWGEKTGEDAWMFAILGGPFEAPAGGHFGTNGVADAASGAAGLIGDPVLGLAIAAGGFLFDLFRGSAKAIADAEKRKRDLELRTISCAKQAHRSVLAYERELTSSNRPKIIRRAEFDCHVWVNNWALNKIEQRAQAIGISL